LINKEEEKKQKYLIL